MALSSAERHEIIELFAPSTCMEFFAPSARCSDVSSESSSSNSNSPTLSSAFYPSTTGGRQLPQQKKKTVKTLATDSLTAPMEAAGRSVSGTSMVDSDFLVELAKVGSWQGLADSSSRPGFRDRESDKDSHILDNLPEDPVLPPQAPDPLIILETAAPVVEDAAPLSVLTLPTFRAMSTNSVNKIKGTRKRVPASGGAIAKPSAPKTIGKKTRA